jgi:hypothetical protein
VLQGWLRQRQLRERKDGSRVLQWKVREGWGEKLLLRYEEREDSQELLHKRNAQLARTF